MSPEQRHDLEQWQHNHDATTGRNGGWQDGDNEDINSRCDIDEVDGRSITAHEFYQNYWLPSKPVVMRGALAAQVPGVRNWTKHALQHSFGEIPVQTGKIPYAVGFGIEGSRHTTLGKYVQSMAQSSTDTEGTQTPHYVFENLANSPSPLADTAGGLMGHYPWRPPFLRLPHGYQYGMRAVSHQFFVGSPGTGAPVHWHGPAWNICAYGRRKWFLFRPHASMYTNKPIGEWLKEDYPRLVGLPNKEERPLECVQRGGDVIFVPQW